MSSSRRMMLAQLLLGLLMLRAYVPAGFMPQYGNPLQLQLCSGRALPPVWMLFEGSAGHASHTPDCPFSHAPLAGPIGADLLAHAASVDFPAPLLSFDTLPSGVRVSLAHRARAPPTLA